MLKHCFTIFYLALQLVSVGSSELSKISWPTKSEVPIKFRISMPDFFPDPPTSNIVPAPDNPRWTQLQFRLDSVVLMKNFEPDDNLKKGISVDRFIRSYVMRNSLLKNMVALPLERELCRTMVRVRGFPAVKECSTMVGIPKIPKNLKKESLSMGLVIIGEIPDIGGAVMSRLVFLDSEVTVDDQRTFSSFILPATRTALINMNFDSVNSPSIYRSAVFKSFLSFGVPISDIAAEDLETNGIPLSMVLPAGLNKYRITDVSNLNDEELDESCSTCLSTFRDTKDDEDLNEILITPCGKRGGLHGHYFHKECIGNWINEHSKCPLCRKFISN